MRFEKLILKEFQDDVDTTSTRVKSLEASQVITLLKTMCKKSWNYYTKTGARIQRFTPTGAQTKYGVLDASRMPDRLSRNTLNYYTQIINHDSNWKKYPRRQVIATYYNNRTGIDTTNRANFIIFPYDSTVIGVCNTDDMWESFPELSKLRMNARSYNQFINRLLNGGEHGNPYDKSLGEFKKRCKQFDKEIGGEIGIEEIQDYYVMLGRDIAAKTLDTYYGDLYQNILQYFGPKGFRTGKGSDIPARNYAEVWFEGPAVFINMTEIDNIDS